MDKFKGKYRIESNRAKFWDYSYPGDYFITICIADRKNILGHIENGIMILSEYGKIVETEIKKIPEYHKRIIMDVWVVMPNHIHLIVSLGDHDFDNGISTIGVDGNADMNGNGDVRGNVDGNAGGNDYKPTIDEIKQYRKQRRKMLIPKILGKFQQQTSKQINILRNTPGTKNWQHDYHDHIIRNNEEYERIKNYIINNPLKWNEDKFNSENAEKQ
jgi:REP element-mobilizing transposase RayT